MNLGPEAARYRGASIATGEYLVGLDSDDLLFPHALETYARMIKQLDEPPVILGALRFFKDGHACDPSVARGGPIEYVRFADFLSKDRGIRLCYSQLVIKRTVAAATGALRDSPTAFPFDIADVMLRAGTCSPFILLTRPATIAYRMHASNTMKRLPYLLQTASCLARLERHGDYPGGRRRLFDRYAYIGTLSSFWIYRALQGRRFGSAARLLWENLPMILVGVGYKVRRFFGHPAPTHALSA